MTKVSLRVFVLIMLLVPSLAGAGSLDDFYLARFAPKAKSVRLSTGVSGQAGVPTAQADRCLTPLHRSLKRDWSKLEPETRKVLAKQVSRPALTAAASYPSPGGHFLIHYATSGADAPDLTDADGNGVPDWVEQVASVFENVYGVEVGAMGYQPPPVSRYDVYLEDLTKEQAYGFTSDDGIPTPPAISTVSYIEIDKAYTDSMFVHTTGGDFTPQQSLTVTAAHEFHHAIQYGYNYYFDIWYAETTSTWMEDEVYDSVNQLYNYLPSYLSKTGTLSLNAPGDGGSEYGRWIFNRYLAQGHTPALVRDVWTRMGKLPATADGSDIPMLPVIDAALAAGGSSLSDEFFGLAKNVYLRNWTSHTGDTGRIPEVSVAGSFSNYPVTSSVAAGTMVTLPQYSFAYYRFLPSTTAPADLKLSFTTPLPSGVKVIAFKKGTDGSIASYDPDPSTGTITVPSFNSGQTAEAQLLVSNNGPVNASGVGFSTDGSLAATVTTTSGKASSSKSGCFIATAAYGSYLHPKVALLRAFRDDYLLSNPPGRLFVALYYRVSPPIADLIARHPLLKGATRLALAPVVFAVEHGRAALVILIIGCGMVVVRRARAAQIARGSLTV